MHKDNFNIEKAFENAQPAPEMVKLEREIQRAMEVADLKEVYSKKHLIKSGLVTKDEYKRIPASDSRKRMQEVASLMYQVVGAEKY